MGYRMTMTLRRIVYDFKTLQKSFIEIEINDEKFEKELKEDVLKNSWNIN
jgi:hypothetical protein